MNKDDDLAYLRDHIDAAVESSSRSRRILVILITISVLVFSAVWNSLGWAWMLQRISATSVISSMLSDPKTTSAPFKADDIQLIKEHYGIVIGVFMMAFGFGRWHSKVQKDLDRMTKLQIEKLELEIRRLRLPIR